MFSGGRPSHFNANQQGPVQFGGFAHSFVLFNKQAGGDRIENFSFSFSYFDGF